MTRKLEELFDLPINEPETDSAPAINETRSALVAIDDTIDKIDSALPAALFIRIKGLYVVELVPTSVISKLPALFVLSCPNW